MQKPHLIPFVAPPPPKQLCFWSVLYLWLAAEKYFHLQIDSAFLRWQNPNENFLHVRCGAAGFFWPKSQNKKVRCIKCKIPYIFYFFCAYVCTHTNLDSFFPLCGHSPRIVFYYARKLREKNQTATNQWNTRFISFFESRLHATSATTLSFAVVCCDREKNEENTPAPLDEYEHLFVGLFIYIIQHGFE